MLLHVNIQTVLLRECFLTQLTLVRLLPRVDVLMNCQVEPRPEPLPTKTAAQNRLVLVSTLVVFLHQLWGIEILGTVVAVEFLLTHMAAHGVVVQVVLVCVGHSTLVADVRPAGVLHVHCLDVSLQAALGFAGVFAGFQLALKPFLVRRTTVFQVAVKLLC